MYINLQSKIVECDVQIEKMLPEQINNDEEKKQYHIGKNVHKRINKNTPKNIDINLLFYQYFEGVDLMVIEGVGYLTVLALMSEVGSVIHKFETARQFASWLRLSPNVKKNLNKSYKQQNSKRK